MTNPLFPINPKGWEKTAESLLEGKVREDDAVQFNSPALGKNYIRTPKNNFIALREANKGLNFENTHFAVHDSGLYMPETSEFMPYVVGVRNAALKRAKLFYADGAQVPQNQVEELWSYLSSLQRGDMGDCWTWLNTGFKKGSGYNSLDIVTYKVQLNSNGQKQLKVASEKLNEILIDYENKSNILEEYLNIT